MADKGMEIPCAEVKIDNPQILCFNPFLPF